MKSKKNIYILLPTVLLVWGLIGYRVFAGLDPDKDMVDSMPMTKEFKPLKLVANNNYTIEANYRDPFLGTLENRVFNKTIPKKVYKQKEEIVFPEILYKGIFSPGDYSKSVFLILIDGEQEMFKLREIHQEVKLISGDKEKIIVKYKKEKKTYYLKS